MRISSPLKIRWIAAHSMMTGMVVSSSATGADQVVSSVSSPDKVLLVTVLRALDGRLSYTVTRNGKLLIAPSRLGFVLDKAAALDAGLVLAGRQISEHGSICEQTRGEQRLVRNDYHQLRLDFTEADRAGRHLSVVFRVFDDGVAFRYELPALKNLKPWKISAELTEFVVAPKAHAWWQQAGEVWARHYPVQKSRLAEVGLASTPLTLRTDDGTHIALHEMELADYPSMWLRKVDGQKLRAQLAPCSTGAALVREGAVTTPWRTIQIADDAAGLYMSTLLLKLYLSPAPADNARVEQLGGARDYPSSILSLTQAHGKTASATQAKQLANFVVIYRPVFPPTEAAEHDATDPLAFTFIRDLPTDWDDTLVLHGAVGEYATVARKDRHSHDWYVGAVTDAHARSLLMPLAFLDPGKRYVADIYRDGEQADYRSLRRFDLIVEHRTVTAADTLVLKLAPGGGQAIRFTPAG